MGESLKDRLVVTNDTKHLIVVRRLGREMGENQVLNDVDAAPRQQLDVAGQRATGLVVPHALDIPGHVVRADRLDPQVAQPP